VLVFVSSRPGLGSDGDVTLGPEWRMLAAFEAANGIITFGCSKGIFAEIAS